MKKKYKRALAAALAAVMIWNTCDWHPQVLAGSSVQYIEEVKELSDEILHQEVPYGTKYKDLELPDKLPTPLRRACCRPTGRGRAVGFYVSEHRNNERLRKGSFHGKQRFRFH